MTADGAESSVGSESSAESESSTGSGSSVGSRYVLITECLQNDFFLNRECRLSLPDTVVRTTLLGKKRFDKDLGTSSRRHLPEAELKAGPLGRFLDATVGRRMRGEDGRQRSADGKVPEDVLDVINIRDWHVEDDAYDAERKRYGAHCESGTWGAAYIDGLEYHLDPGGPQAGDPTRYAEPASYFEGGNVRIHHVHADSMFDFRPRSQYIGESERKFQKSALEILLDVLFQGSDANIEEMREKLAEDGHPRALLKLSRDIDNDETIRCDDRIYVAVIGVYTDLKIGTLLGGLRTRYNLPNLAVSDTLTASATLERHLSGLDYAAKVLGVEVIHGINDLARFLGGRGEIEDESAIVSSDSFARYQSFFQDQQNVLAYETQRLQEYTILTERRSRDVYDTVKRSNKFLIVWGATFLVATLVLSIASAVAPDSISWKLPAITAGVSLAQFLGAFFTQPMSDMQRNLTNLATFRMILESHSLKTAFARFHLTTPGMLRELRTKPESDQAARQINTLERQLSVIQSLDRADFESLRDLGFRADGAAAPAVEVPPAPAAAEESPGVTPNGDGSAPA